MSRVYVIILNYKKWDEVIECLETLFRSDYDHFTAIVIDNGSQNNSLEKLVSWAGTDSEYPNPITSFAKRNIEKPIDFRLLIDHAWDEQTDISSFPKMIFVNNERNKGFAGGINTVLKWLVPEDAYVWLLNPDMIIEESTLSELVKFAGSAPRRSIIGTVVKYHNDPKKVHFYAGGKVNFNSATVQMITNKDNISELDYISGGSFFTHTNTFAELGLLPEDYFLYWEETDCCYRAKKAGYQLSLCETATCYDKVSTSIGKSFLSDYYYTRNGLFFLQKYKKGKVSVAIFFTIFRLMKRIFSAQFDRATGMYHGLISFLNREKHAHK